MLTGSIALKEDDVQFISAANGDVPAENTAGLGLYYQDTRFLNRFELTVNGERPLFLSNSVNKRYIATFQAINPPFTLPGGQRARQQTVSIRRSRFVTKHGLFERIGFLNCNHFRVQLEVVLGLDADFRDIFTVRGFKTQRVAGQISVGFGNGDVVFSYRGRDALRRTTHCTFSRVPEAISARDVRFAIELSPQQHDSIIVHVQPCVEGERDQGAYDYETELELLAESYRDWDGSSTQISTDNELFDREVLRASRYDIRTLLETTPEGKVPDAGIPWYAVPFGRDSIITALQTLMYNPSIALGTLKFLAKYQGVKVDRDREEEPGKIMHEVRRGELARLHEVPHTPYFGTIDATPLFIILFVQLMAWTGSDEAFETLMPHVSRALEWIDAYGDVDGDGFIEYVAHRPGGVVNHGWKDSATSVQYENGENAEQPIALVEVQGYVYQAKMGMSRLLAERGQSERSALLAEQASQLKEIFNRDFWMEDERYYALALDGQKRQVRSVSSNAGHCLWSGICDLEKANAVARRLLEPDMFSGWGVRTLSTGSPNYNPMSYHNGSVWPHDTSIIAMGLRHAGHANAAIQLVNALIESGTRFQDGRLPELFCGFERDQRFNSSPAEYVVSCSPQAWAAGCVFQLLQIVLDLRPDARRRQLFISPLLPELFERIDVKRLMLGDERVSLTVRRSGDDLDVDFDADNWSLVRGPLS